MTEAALFDLMSWMSPAWPIGGFAHSGGLEWAVEDGHITDRRSAADWIATLLDQGPLHNDIVLFVHAWRAADAGDAERLREVANLALAAQTGAERRIEATAQGAAFRKIAVASINPPRTPLGEGWSYASLLAAIDDDELCYPIAAAALFACQGIALRPALTAWVHGAVSNLISAALRLVPLGQTDGQLLLRQLRVPILATVEGALDLPNDDPFAALGGCALLAEIGCMAHETQYTRLFRT
ncbi:MAG: urease accessory protein UreF [Novosphingobium sp.]